MIAVFPPPSSSFSLTLVLGTVCLCARSIANVPLHLTIFTCFHPLSQTTLDFHSLIHLFFIHSIEYNGWKKSLTKLNAIDKNASFLRPFKWLLVV